MPISPLKYSERAAELEKLATTVSDPAMKQEYLNLAAELRRLAPLSLQGQSDEDIQRLAERMVGNTTSKL
jgi:hypothetical protein